MNAKQEALRATEMAFCNRICGMTPPSQPYTGTFPVEQVANAVDIPESSSELHHRAAWNRLRKLFTEEWNDSHRQSA